MFCGRSISRISSLLTGSLLLAALPCSAQQQRHGRGYKPLPPTATIEVLVEKAFNEKPFPNAAVVFRAERDGKLTGNLETKTDPDGKAVLDLLEVGSHVTVQVIASGFATYAGDFDLTSDGKQLVVKLQRPRAQVSTYRDNQDRAAEVQPGVQEHRTSPAPNTGSGQTVATPNTSPTSPLTTTPLTHSTPAAQPATPASGSPQ